MQPHPKISLLLATLGRTEQIKLFLEKVQLQSYRDFEIVVVDQNDDNRLDSVLSQYGAGLSINHLRSTPGLSKARNVGLNSCRGDIIAFPDDDCWYPPDLLERVVRLLDSDFDGVTGRQLDAQGEDAGPRYDREDGPITLFNVWGRGISSCIFLKRHAVEAVGRFDETLGVGAGTMYGSGEETDYLIRVLKAGFTMHYLPALFVRHPPSDKSITPKILERTYFYGAGMGRVLRKHEYPLWFKARSLTRPLLGAVLALAYFKPMRARLHLTRCLGRSRGLLAQSHRSP
jgi:glycosyltransferase involved in cell wall biosynthesis